VTLVSVGTCTIQATQAGNATYAAATPVNQSFQVTQGTQTIAFGALSTTAFGSAPFTVSATASSGLPVSFSSQTTSVCTVAGANVTLVAAGTCTIQATQAGNANYAAATPVNQSFQVTQGAQTITFGCSPLSGPSLVGTAYSASCTVSGGTQPYNWSIVSGSLPAGLSLSATTGGSIAVSGTPTLAGTYAYSVKVTDSSTPTALSTSQAYSGTIQPTALLFICSSWQRGRQRHAHSRRHLRLLR
jgi:hypothetical protein